MARKPETTRRTVLRASGALAAGTLLAGCSGGSGGSGGDDPTDSSGDGGQSLDGWFDGVSNYDGGTEKTDSDAVTVEVGVDGNNGTNAFGPAELTVSTGTTVTWEWTGDGRHNVVAEDGSFESDYHSSEGATFEHTFEETGTYKYACVPHKSMGMKGAIVVE